MATITKSLNGIEKSTVPLSNKPLTKKVLAKKSVSKPETKPTPEPIPPMIELENRIRGFEKLRGLADQRERLNQTLTDIQRFNYHNDGTSTFFMRDSQGKEFRTTNSNLIELVGQELQTTLEARKLELETEIMKFQL